MEQVTEAGQYQVFINHRGLDTKKNLASLIYNALEPYGLRVFLDQDELCTGDTVYPAIRTAINSASVYIAIFSPHYAESHWCLNELCWMMSSSHESKVIIPVFCDVEPGDLGHIDNGCYAEAFDKYQREEKVSTKDVDDWKMALKKASKITGLLFRTNESDQGKFLKGIENIVINHVKWDPLEVATHPVGLYQAMKDLDEKLQEQSSPKVVVIAGLGGIGKSTLARHIFNSKRSKFSRASYLFNVSENVDLTSLQRQMLRDLRGKDMDFPNPVMGRKILRNSLKGLKILIVFDVVNSKEIKTVLDMDAVAPGSLIFITSRDKDIFGGSSANTFLYDVKPLKRSHARALFCRHAFGELNPPEEYEDLVEEFLKICGGLPLCLEVLGEQLAGKLDSTYWKEQLELFFQGQPLTEANTVINTLKWSYKAMEIEQQEMLLDVGCFFVGEDVELAIRVLEGLGYLGVPNLLESLRQKCLVDFNDDVLSQDYEIGNRGQNIQNPVEKLLTGMILLRELISQVTVLPRHTSKIIMQNQERELEHVRATVLPRHTSKIIMQNQVRELARRIVREDLHKKDKPLRLSCSIDIQNMLQLQSGSVSCRIRGICIRKGRSPPELPKNINITGVRLLVVESPIDSSWFGSCISQDLVWLRWRNSHRIPLRRPISLRNLRVLELQGPKDDLLEDFFHSIEGIPLELRDFIIHSREEGASSSTSSSAQPVDLQHSTKPTLQDVMPSLFRFLQSIGSLMKNLTKIVLKNFTVPQSLPFDCLELKNLRHLDLSGSTNLTTLPNSFSQLLQLQHLLLRDCSNLSIPEDILGAISTLEHIDLKGCAQLEYLPKGIASQRRLRYLNLLETSLIEFPSNIGPLDELEHLRIGSFCLRELPRSVDCFVHLKVLILTSCMQLNHNSTPIERLTCLERLEIHISNVQILPPGITVLKHLKVLAIYSCPIREFSLDNNVMDALTDLTLFNTHISDISIPAGACPRLEIVNLSYNNQLLYVQVFQSTLVKLNLDGCSMLMYMQLPKLVHLKFLNINGCGHVRTLNVDDWRSLEEITAESCWTLWITEEEWSQLERLNFFSFSRKFLSAGRSQLAKRVKELEKFMLEKRFCEEFMVNSFRDVRIVEVPETATRTSPLVLNNVRSQTAIMMCFLTTDHDSATECNNFVVRFEGCNSGFETASGDGEGGLVLHIYMWTYDSNLFRGEDDLYNNVDIYKKGNFNVEGGERGWIVTFLTENHDLNVFKQLMGHMWTMSI